MLMHRLSGQRRLQKGTHYLRQQTPDWTEHTCGNIGQGRDGCYMLQVHWAGQILCDLHGYHSTVHIVNEAKQRRRSAHGTESCNSARTQTGEEHRTGMAGPSTSGRLWFRSVRLIVD